MKIGHIALYVNDLESAKNFFVTYFNGTANTLYHNPKTDFSSYFITFGNSPTKLEIMNKPGMRVNDKDRLGYAHLAFNLGSKEDVDNLTSCLSKDGYEIYSGPRITGDGYYESCIIGIEGNLIELTV